MLQELRGYVSPKVWHYVSATTKTKPYQVFAVSLKGEGQRYFGSSENTERRAELYIAVTAEDAETIDEILSNATKHFDRYTHTTSDGLRVIKMTHRGGQIQYSETNKQFTGFGIYLVQFTGDV